MGIAALTASEFLLGAPQVEWFSLLMETAFALFYLVSRGAGWRLWAALAAAKVLGLCLSAVQLAATYDFLSASNRAVAERGFQYLGSLPPLTFLGVLAPYLGRGETPGWDGKYFGAFPLLLVLWWLTGFRAGPAEAGRGPISAGRLSVFALLVAGLTIWLSTGVYGKLYCLQTYLPVIGKLRCPDRYLWLTELCLSIVSACAFARLVAAVRGGQRLPWRHLALPWLAVAAAVGVAVWLKLQGVHGIRHSFQASLRSGPILFTAAGLALTLAHRGRRVGLFALVLVGVVDLGLFSMGNRDTREIWQPWRCFALDKLAAVFPVNPAPPPARLWSILNNQAVLAGHHLVSGYGGMYPRQQLDYDHVKSLRVASVEFYHDFQWDQPPKNPPGLGSADRCGWRRVPDPLPRARLLTALVVSADAREMVKQIDVDRQAVVERPLPVTLSQPGTARITADRPGAIVIQTDAPAAQLLSVSESYNAGCGATVGERSVPVQRVNGDYLGLVVPAGRQQVRLVFDPACLRAGKAVSLSSLILWLGLAVACVLPRTPNAGCRDVRRLRTPWMACDGLFGFARRRQHSRLARDNDLALGHHGIQSGLDLLALRHIQKRLPGLARAIEQGVARLFQ